MDYWLVAAGALSAAVALIHIFLGGPTVAKPLLDAQDIEPMPKFVTYYCWHSVSFTLLAMAALFWVAGAGYAATPLALVGTLHAAFLCAWGVALPVLKRQSYASMPQGWLFLPIAILGVLGLLEPAAIAAP